MRLSAEQVPASHTTLVVVVFMASLIAGLGYRVAVMRRANSDYKKVKAGLPGMRKTVWQALWGVVKYGFWASLGALVLVSWVIHDVRQSAGR